MARAKERPHLQAWPRARVRVRVGSEVGLGLAMGLTLPTLVLIVTLIKLACCLGPYAQLSQERCAQLEAQVMEKSFACDLLEALLGSRIGLQWLGSTPGLTVFMARAGLTVLGSRLVLSRSEPRL